MNKLSKKDTYNKQKIKTKLNKKPSPKLSKKIKFNYKKNVENKNKNKQKLNEKLLSYAGKIDAKLYYKTKKYRIKIKEYKEKLKSKLTNKYGYYIYTIYGLNLSKILNILKQYIQIYDTEITDKLILKINGKDRKKLERILDNYRYKYTYTIQSKLYYTLSFINNKKILTSMILFVGIFYLFTNLFVLKININTYQYEVDKILKNEGIKIGTKLTNIDTFYLERKIIEQLDISFCDIKIVGNTLNVKITEAKTPIKTEKPNINNVVVATCDCIISRELIYSGTKTKNIYDVVKKGDILINNFVMADEIKIPVIASGDIYGLIQKGKTIEINKNQLEKIKTGNTKTITTLSFTNKFKNDKPPYKLYGKEENIMRISDIIPLYKKTTTYHELKIKNIKYDKNMIIKKFVPKVTNELKSTLPVKAKYNRTFYTINENEDKYILNCYIEYEDKVSTLSSLNS